MQIESLPGFSSWAAGFCKPGKAACVPLASAHVERRYTLPRSNSNPLYLNSPRNCEVRPRAAPVLLIIRELPTCNFGSSRLHTSIGGGSEANEEHYSCQHGPAQRRCDACDPIVHLETWPFPGAGPGAKSSSEKLRRRPVLR